ncbi:MAG: hypothetical protein ACO1TE_08910 [Prosthecobacter sp.]
MATGTSSETLSPRQEALQLLERGRAELSAEARWLRDRVNPKEALKRGVENHPVLLIGGGLAIGLVATLLLLRRKHHAPAHHSFSHHQSYAPPRRSSLTGQLLGQAAHMLLPLVVMPALEKFVKQQLHRSQTHH